MKHFILFFAFLFLTPTSFAQITTQEMRDYADHFLSAIGTFSPDPIMASAIGAAPDLVKRYIHERCNTQMLRVNDELMENKYSIKRFNELMELLIRAQALDSANNGDSTALLDFEKNKKTKKKQKENELKKKQKEEEKDDMNFFLGLLREDVNKLNALKNQILAEGSTNLNLIKDKFSEVRNHLIQYKYTKDEMNNYKTRTSNLVVLGEDICDEATNLRTKIFDLSKVMKDGEKIINTKISQANARAANCQSAEDGVFVKTSYNEAKQAFAISKKAKESALNYFKDIEIHHLQIERFNAALDSSYTVTKNKPLVTDNKWHEKASDLLTQTTDPLEQLKSRIIENEAFPDKKKKLIEKIDKSKNFYIQSFPKHEEEFNQLIREVKSINLDSYRVNALQLSDLQNEYNRLLDALLYNRPSKRDIKNQFKIKQYAISCFSIKSTKKEKDKIEEVFFREFLLIKYNEKLVDGCVPVPTEITQEDTTEKPDTTVSSVDPPTTATDTTTSKTPEKSIFGGLTIGGPSQVTVGKAAHFIALDGVGDPLPNEGSYEWLNTREGLMVLSKSGITAQALGFKPGKATIILKYDGMREYKDIEIVEMEKDSQSVSASNDDLENNQHQEKCSELIDRITIFLNSPNISEARKHTNRAIALGCDVNAGAVNALIAQIEDSKRKEQEAWERDYANQNIQHKSDAARNQKREQNISTFMNFLGEGIAAVAKENDRERQEKNDKKAADFEKSQQKINDYLANTQKPPISGASTNNSTNGSSNEKPDSAGIWIVTHKCIQDDEPISSGKVFKYWDSKLGKDIINEWSVGSLVSSSKPTVGYISDSKFWIQIELNKKLPQNEVRVKREFEKVRLSHYLIATRIVEITVNKNSFYGTITENRKFYYTGRDAGVRKWTLKGIRK